MTHTCAGGEPVHLDFLLYLRGNGFAVSVDQYISAHALLDEYLRALERAGEGPHAPDGETLKTLLCPLFAKDSKQQERFYTVFDEYVEHVRSLVRNDEAIEESEVFIPPPPWWKSPAYVSAALLLLVAAALVAWLVLRPYVPSASNNNATNNNSGTNANFNTNANGNGNTPPTNNEGDENKGSNKNRGERPVHNANESGPRPTPDTGVLVINASPQPAQSTPQLKPSPTPTPPTPAPPPYYYLLAAALPFSAFMLSELVLYLMRKLVLGRQPPRKPPAVWPLSVESPPPPLYGSDEFHKAARMLRRRQVGEYHRLDIPSTVSATVEALGFPSFRYRPDSKVPEYLVLIDRASTRDHLARLFDELSRALEREGLFITRLFYEGDPRVCCDESGRDCLQLSEIQNRHAGQRLLLFGDGDALIDAESGRLVPWAEMFSEWQERALLTPAPRWGLREKTLADLFAVVPSTPEGINALAARFESLTVENLPLWPRGGDAPPARGEPRLADALREHLGARLFRWVAACAAYPELQWDLTLLIGSLPSVGGGRGFDEGDILRLARLSWFREGSMPDDVRLVLIEELEREDPAALAEVRAALVGLLERESPPEGSVASERHALELAVQRWLLNRDEESLAQLRATARAVRPGQILRDRTLVRYLERLPNAALDILLPRRLRRLFFRHGLPLFGTRTLGRFLLWMLLAAVLLSAVSLNAFPPPTPKPPATPTPTPTVTPTETPSPTPPVVNPPGSPSPMASPTPTPASNPSPTPPPAANAYVSVDVLGEDGKRFNGRVNILVYTTAIAGNSFGMNGEDANQTISVPKAFPEGDCVVLAHASNPLMDGKVAVILQANTTTRVTVILRRMPTPTPTSTPIPTLTPTPTPPFAVTRASLRVAVQGINGPCPDTISFAGAITVNGAGTVKYHFLNNVGVPWDTQSLTFDGPGTKDVGTRLEIGGPGRLSYSGWVMIEVESPNKLQSNRADFKGSCQIAEDTIIKSVSVTFHTTTNKKNKGDSVTVRLLDGGRDEGGVNSVGANEDWVVRTTKTLTFGNFKDDVSYKGCGMVLVVSKSGRNGALRGSSPFVNASLQDSSPQTGDAGRQHHKWAMWVSVVATLEDGRTVTLLARSQDFLLGEDNPNTVKIPLPCN